MDRKQLACLARRALQGMNRCMPETKADDQGCIGCPYRNNGCQADGDGEASIFPAAMLRDIRQVLQEAANGGK